MLKEVEAGQPVHPTSKHARSNSILNHMLSC